MNRLLRWMHGEINIDNLKKRGLKIGNNVSIMGEVRIDSSHCWHITIGNNVTLAPQVYILAHDASTYKHLGYTRIGKVVIGDNVFIGARSLILPGSTIGSNSIIGAGSVVSGKIPENSVAIGSPAKIISSLEDYLTKRKEEMKAAPLFDESYTLRKNVSNQKKAEMNDRIGDGFGYVK